MEMFPTIPFNIAGTPHPTLPGNWGILDRHAPGDLSSLVDIHQMNQRLDRLEDRLGRLMLRDRMRAHDKLNVSVKKIGNRYLNDNLTNIVQEFAGRGNQRRRSMSRRSKMSRKHRQSRR